MKREIRSVFENATDTIIPEVMRNKGKNIQEGVIIDYNSSTSSANVRSSIGGRLYSSIPVSKGAGAIVPGDKVLLISTDPELSSRVFVVAVFGPTQSQADNGWIPVSETWVRTGNHTFTVNGGAGLINKYRLGTKVRYDRGGIGYGVIGSRVVSGQNLNVTLIENSDFVMTAGSIENPMISYIENPEGFPQWFRYHTITTVVWAGGTTDPTTFALDYALWRVYDGVYEIKFKVSISNRGSGNRTNLRMTNPEPINTQTTRDIVAGSAAQSMTVGQRIAAGGTFIIQGGGVRADVVFGAAMSQASGDITFSGAIPLDPRFT